MPSLNDEYQSKCKFHLGYNWSVPAVDVARLMKAMTDLPDEWTKSRVISHIDRCETSYALTHLSDDTLLEISKDTRSVTRTGTFPSATNRIQQQYDRFWATKVKAYEYDVQILATTLSVRNYRDLENAVNAYLNDKGVYIESVRGDKGEKGDGGADLRWMGGWNAWTEYQKNDSVSYSVDGNAYVSKVAGNVGNTPTPLLNAYWDIWLLRGEQGEQGEAGPEGPQGPEGPRGDIGLLNITWRGEWSVGTSYSANDMVTYAGNSYIANSANTGVTPSSGAEWDVFGSGGGGGGSNTPFVSSDPSYSDVEVLVKAHDFQVVDVSSNAYNLTNRGLSATTQYLYGTDACIYDDPFGFSHAIVNKDLSAVFTSDYTLDFRVTRHFFASNYYSGMFNVGENFGSDTGMAIESRYNSFRLILNNYNYISSWYSFTNYDEWVHGAIVRTGGDYKFYIDGVLQLTYTSAYNPSGSFFVVGAYVDSTYAYGGYIHFVRLTKSVRYASTFDPDLDVVL